MTQATDRDIIRRLTAEMAEIARGPEQKEKIEGWKRVNGLKEHRPMLCITEIPWGEFEGKVDELRPCCEDDGLRKIETGLRRELFSLRRLPSDKTADGAWHVPMKIDGGGYGVEIKEQLIAQGDSYVKSHHYEPAIKDIADVEKILMPRISHDAEDTARRKAFFEDLVGDIVPVEVCGPRRHFFPAWDTLVRWTGVTEALEALVDRPEFIHAIMRRMTDATLASLTQHEEQNLLSYPHPVPRVGSGGAGWTDELPQPDHDPKRYRTMDQWGGATAQIFGEVSPRMHEEFALNYEIEVMSRFGLNYYGCCEPLHGKMKMLHKVPRLRKVSISPWCDVAKAAENATRKYVFSHKPNPACFAEDRFDAARAEKDLRDRLARSGGMPCEVIMKDISTVRGDVERLIAWCTMAYRVVNE